ncbi:MAG: hypothetical protein HYX74_02430 [Acidobacteria bacterium]|nr:hypothetical protein [Acidobacteriota bacterium]
MVAVLSQQTVSMPQRGWPGPPAWFLVLTAVFTLLLVAMAVAETTLWFHFLVDRGESLSLVGLGFAFLVGTYLYRRRQLDSSLILFIPWLLYPVLTQGDQLIDSLTMNQMRLVCNLILAVIFMAPLAIVTQATCHFLAPVPGQAPGKRRWTLVLPGLRLIEQGRAREGAHLLAMTLLLLELWIAYRYLGQLLVLTLLALGLLLLFLFTWRASGPLRIERSPLHRRPLLSQRLALAVLLAGLIASSGLYLGLKNRTMAHQGGHPHHHHGATDEEEAYDLQQIVVPPGKPQVLSPQVAAQAGAALQEYARVLQGLLHGYYVLDRNYNYAFHNALFIRNTPVLPGFRARALSEISQARRLAADADARLQEVLPILPEEEPMAAFLREVRGSVSYNLGRASLLEGMSAEFEKSEPGLQHATHLYEGEGKALGAGLMRVLDKHRSTIEDRAVSELCDPFVKSCQEIQRVYANRIVGF